MVPQPFVNPESESYLDISETPFKDRVIDDYLPRKNKDQLYHAKKLVGEDDIKACSTKFLIERRFVDKRIQHLKLLTLNKELRKRQKRKDRNVKQFEDYNWEE